MTIAVRRDAMTNLRDIEITPAIVAKVLDVVDAGLVSGVGVAVPGQMCVEAAVCFALGLPHDDDPQCVSRAVRSLKIKLNDATWSSDQARACGLRRLAVAQLGSRDKIDDKKFARRVADLAIRKSVPAALRLAASVQTNAEHRDSLLNAACRCEAAGTEQSVRDARACAAAADAAAYAAAYAANAADAYAADAYAAYAAANAAADAAYACADADAYACAAAADAYAADADAAYAAANAADAAAYAADAAAYAADAATPAAAAAAAYAAAYAANAQKKTRDESLASFAEGVVQILVSMNAPGCQFLHLTETMQ
jgi:hypothetical protein